MGVEAKELTNEDLLKSIIYYQERKQYLGEEEKEWLNILEGEKERRNQNEE